MPTLPCVRAGRALTRSLPTATTTIGDHHGNFFNLALAYRVSRSRSLVWNQKIALARNGSGGGGQRLQGRGIGGNEQHRAQRRGQEALKNGLAGKPAWKTVETCLRGAFPPMERFFLDRR